MSNDHRITRKAIIAGAALLGPGVALAQTGPPQPPNAQGAVIWSKRYAAMKGP